MNKTEFASIAMALRTYYPRENMLPNDAALDLWFEALQDLNAGVVEAALKKWVKIEKWPPTIADLREQAAGSKYEVAMEYRRRQQAAIAQQAQKEIPQAVQNALQGLRNLLQEKANGGADNA